MRSILPSPQSVEQLKSFLFDRQGLLVLWLITLILMLLPEHWVDWLSYVRSEISTGQVWRLITGHLVHGNWTHWWLNTAGLALVIWVCPTWMGRMQGLGLFFWLSLVVGTGLYLLEPALWGYTGLSGVLYGLFVVALAFSPFYSKNVRLIGVAVVAAKLLADKLGWFSDEFVVGLIGSAVAHNAHLLGLGGGLVYLLNAWFFSSRSSS